MMPRVRLLQVVEAIIDVLRLVIAEGLTAAGLPGRPQDANASESGVADAGAEKES